MGSSGLHSRVFLLFFGLTTATIYYFAKAKVQGTVAKDTRRALEALNAKLEQRLCEMIRAQLDSVYREQQDVVLKFANFSNDMNSMSANEKATSSEITVSIERVRKRVSGVKKVLRDLNK